MHKAIHAFLQFYDHTRKNIDVAMEYSGVGKDEIYILSTIRASMY